MSCQTSDPARRPALPSGVILGLALALASLTVCLSAAPAGAAVPGAPKLLAAAGYQDAIRIFIAPPSDDGGSAVIGYKIVRTNGMTTTNFDVTSTAMYADTSAADGTTYEYKVLAINTDGESAASNTISATRAAITDFSKFGAGAGAKADFVDRQYQDLLGRAPTPTELSAALDGLGDSTFTAAAFIDSLVTQPDRVLQRQPVIRLYFAYFDRAPDHGGMDFWVDARKNHGKSIDDESSSFAGSNEFKTTYGSLSNVRFVTLVYNNVLKRDPDSTGLSFWTDQLNTHQSTRGRMMTQFSESNEFKNASNGRTLAADVFDDLYGAMISVGDLRDWGAHIQGGGTAGGYATELIRGSGYPAS